MSIRLAAVVALTACHAPPSTTARFHDVTGGARWASVRGIDSRGTIEVGGMTGAFTSVEDVSTGRHREKLELGPVTLGDGYDGTAGWELTTGGEVVVPDAPEARALAVTEAWLVRRGYFSPAGARYRELGANTERDRHYHVVEATPDGGAPIELWFDDATGLLARTRDRDGINTVVTTFDDYRDVGGLRLPFVVVTDPGDPRNRTTTRLAEVHLRDVSEAELSRPRTDDRVTFAADTAEVPFELVNNHIYIHATVDGKPVRMIVDTGGLNLLTPAAVARLGLASEGQVAVSGTGTDKVDAGFARGHALEVGGVRLADPAFYVLDFGSLNDVEGEPFDGLVGFELFHRMVVRIDYPARTLVLAKPGSPPPVNAIAVPFELRERTPIVAGEIDGIPARLTIDTGARNALSITSPFVRAHDLEGRYKPAFETVTGWGVGGEVRAKPVRIAQVKLGSASVDAVAGELFTGAKGALADPDSSANVGSGLLKRFVVTFDYEHHVMYLAPSPIPVRDIYDRCGMFVIAAGEALKVVAITRGGPADRASVRADDRIAAIDGQPISSRHVAAWREILSAGEIGSKHVLELASGAKRTLVLAELLP